MELPSTCARRSRGAAVAARLAAAAARTAAGRAAEGPALSPSRRRDQLRSGAASRPVLAHRHRRTSSSRRTPTTTSRGRARSGRRPPTAMPEVTDDCRTWTVSIKRHLLRRRPGVQGREARAGRAGLRLSRSSASSIRRTRARPVACVRKAGSSASTRCARRRQEADAVRLRRADPDCRRSTATRCRFRLAKPDFDFVYVLATLGRSARRRARWSSTTASDIGAHPVGTGPFSLKQWQRSSKIVLERNPNFREAYYDAEPARTTPKARRFWRR